jgi:hypothetical protein
MLELWRASTFRDFSGARLELRVPLTATVLNQLAAAAVAAHRRRLRAIGVAVAAGNRLELSIAPARPAWLPALPVPIVLRPDLVPAPDPRVVAEVASGSLAAAAVRLVTAAGVHLPPGVDIIERRIELSLLRLAPSQDLRLLAGFIREGRLSTEPGVLWLTLVLSAP